MMIPATAPYPWTGLGAGMLGDGLRIVALGRSRSMAEATPIFLLCCCASGFSRQDS